MPTEEHNLSEREQTDASLRIERDKADRAIGEELAGIDEVADAVVGRARSRADAVLATARARVDRQQSLWALPSSMVERERAVEDQVLLAERAQADHVVRIERAELVDLLSIDRQETDKDLFIERVRSDDVLATLDEVLSVVGNDLREMLDTMVGSAGLIAKGVSQEQHVELVFTHADRIQRSGAKMGRLIGDLVDVASIEAGILPVIREVGDPAQVVTEAVEAFQPAASASGVSLVSEIEPSAPLALFDAGRILQVLTVFLSNAIKCTPANGKVVVHVERIGTEIRFAVSDAGSGVPTGKLEAVFERSVLVRKDDRRGVDLGLYISRCIVLAHGGRIWAESRIGEGSTFCFTLPIHVAPSQSAGSGTLRE